MSMRISTGVSSLDAVIGGGYQGGTLHLVVGRTGGYKSTFLRRILTEAAVAGHRCLFMSEDHIYNNQQWLKDTSARKPSGKVTWVQGRYGLQHVRQYLAGGDFQVVLLDSGLEALTSNGERMIPDYRLQSLIFREVVGLASARSLVVVSTMNLRVPLSTGFVPPPLAPHLGSAEAALLAETIVQPVQDDIRTLGAMLAKNPYTNNGGWYF
jgi:hypothetical protein